MFDGSNWVCTSSVSGKWSDVSDSGDIYYTGGNVGIGTDSPAASLEINSYEDDNLLIHSASATGWSRIALTREGETDHGFLGYHGTNSHGTSSGMMLGATGEHVIRFNSNGNDQMTIYPSGDVSIPYGNLSVSSGDLSVPNGNVGIGTSSPSEVLEIQAAEYSGPHNIGFRSNENWGSRIGYTDVSDGSGQHYFHIDGKHAGTWDNNQFVVRSDSGNVGIGTTDPGAKLTVQEDGSGEIARFSGNRTDGASWVMFQNEASENSHLFGIGVDHNEKWHLEPMGATGINMSTEGNVGIGTADPGEARLHVEGGLVARGFESDYSHNNKANYWNKIATCTMYSQYQWCSTSIYIRNGGHTYAVNDSAQISFYVKQQNPLGGATSTELTVERGQDAFSADEVRGVITKNIEHIVDANNEVTQQGEVVVELWVKNKRTYSTLYFNPLTNKRFQFHEQFESQPELPAGEQIYAVGNFYSNHNGNTGIGTNSPDAKLDINGTTHLRNSLTIDSFIASTYLPTISQAKYLELFSVDGTNYLAAAGLPAYQDDKIVDATDIYIYSYSESDFEDFELVSTLVPGSAINSIKPFQIDGTTYLAVAMEGNSQSKIYQWSSGAFVDIANNNGTLSFETSDIEPFTTEDGNAYIAVADTTDSQTRIQIWNGSNFSKTEFWSFTGLTNTADIQYIKIGDREFLAFADNADADQSFRLFEYSNGQFDFSAPIQTLARTNLNRIQTFVHNNATYIALSHEHIVEMLQWDDETSSFQTFQGFYTTEQTSNTSEASGALYFTRGSEEYLLALSNTAQSKLHRWNGSQFEFIQNFSWSADQTLDAVAVNGGNTFLLAYASNGSSTGSSIRKHHWDTNLLVSPGYGKVSIGTNSTNGAKLAVVRNDSLGNIAHFAGKRSDGAAWVTFQNNASQDQHVFGIGVDHNEKLNFSPMGAMGIGMDKDGNVGIGTQSPDAKLEVHAGSNVLENVVDGALLNINQAYPGGGTATAADYKDASITLGVNVSHGKISAGGSFSDNDPGHLSLFTRNATSKELEEAMRIDHNGNVGIGTTEPRAKLEITSDGEEDNDLLIHSKTTGAVGSPADWARISLMREGETDEGFLGFYGTNLSGGSSGLMLGVSGEHVIRFNTNGGDKMFIYPNGDVGIAGTVTAGGETLDSDIRYKKDIQTLPSALQNILSLHGVSYYWKDRDDDTQQIGVIAQEVEKIYPQLVHTNEDGYKSVAYANLVSPLIEAVKELHALYQGHADRLVALEAQNVEQDNHIAHQDERIAHQDELIVQLEVRLAALEAAQ